VAYLSLMRASVTSLVESATFKRCIVFLIIINAATLGLETSPAIMAEHGETLHLFDRFVLGIFIGELVLRLYAHRSAFLKDPWSLFDAAVVGIALLPHGGEFAVLRTLRVLRVLRLISMIPSMRRVVSALLTSLSGVAAVASIMLVIFYVFSVIATTLFAAIEPKYFGTLGHTMLTLFQIMTLEDWANIARPVMEHYPYAWMFFVSYILVSTFVIMNLFIGVMVYAIQQSSGPYSGPERRRATPEQKAALKLLDEGGLIDEIRALRQEITTMHTSKNGFTLLEMSIVLAVIGLIMGGILVGQDMIGSSTRMAFITEMQKYGDAVGEFKLKYGEVPGDMSDASSYWSGAANGDGNGFAAYGANRACVPANEGPFWHHLALAELIPGDYSAANATSNTLTGGIGPESPFDGGFWIANYAGTGGGNAGWNICGISIYGQATGQYLALGGGGATASYRTGVIDGTTARAIDEKIDDGEPEFGKFLAIKGYTGAAFEAGCTDQAPTVAAGTAVAYDLASADLSCHPIFFID
jgi:voltage-gated sodium channel